MAPVSHGKPCAGNPHVRFDEGEVASAATPRSGSLLYRKAIREAAVLATAILAGAALVAGAETADKIHIRDPFVVVDREKGCYCLLSSCFAPPGERGNDFFAFLGTGAKIYESKDLVNWSEARQLLTIPDWVGCRALWAPELHQFRGKWYILGTVNGADNRRGTWTFVS